MSRISLRSRVAIAVAVVATATALTGVATLPASAATGTTALHFDKGSSRTAVTVRIPQGGDRSFSVSARSGQSLAVATSACGRTCPGGTSPAPDIAGLSWSLTSPTGHEIAGQPGGGQVGAVVLDRAGTWTVRLHNSGTRSTFRLSVAVSPFKSTTYSKVTGIAFDRGTTSTTLTGHLKAQSARSYSFRARKGQTLALSLASGREAGWELVTPDGQPLHRVVSDDQSGGSVTLPVSGTYRLKAVSAGAGTGYAMAIAIS